MLGLRRSFHQGCCYKWLDIPYTDTTHPLQRLDIYTPKEDYLRGKLPVCVYIHGGSWQRGDKQSKYSLAIGIRSGCVSVLINYRLSPDIQHPEHAHDVLNGVSWLQRHISTFGGDPSRIFIIGHSAGAHLAFYLACQLSNSVFQESVVGLVGLSGPYNIIRLANAPFYGSIATNCVFGSTVQRWREASPSYLTLLHPSAMISRIPVLLLTASNDFHMNTDADEMKKNLNNNVKRITIQDCHHLSILTSDQVNRLIQDFISEN